VAHAADEVRTMKSSFPFKDDNDFIVMWLLGALFIALLVWFVFYGYNTVIEAAYDASKVIPR
jgi:hypothetical protein